MSVDMMSPKTSFDSTAVNPLGHRVVGNNGKVYRYAYNAGADTWVAGELLGFSQTGATYGYCSGTAADIVDSTSSATPGVGIALAAIPTTKYGWVQTEGPNEVAMTSDGNVAIGSSVSMGGTTSPDGTLILTADGAEEHFCGMAVAADSGTTCAIGSIVLGCDKFW